VIGAAASVLDRKAEDVARAAGAPMLAESSIKKALDLEWSDPQQKAGAVMTIVEQLDALETWVAKHLPEQSSTRRSLISSRPCDSCGRRHALSTSTGLYRERPDQ